jgi:hypothetical protein
MSQTNSSPDLDSAARESLIFARLQAWDKAITSGPEIGIMCRDVRDGELWRYHEGCTSFDSWMVLAAPRARSTAYGYLRQVEALSDIPDEHLGQIRGENVDTVKQLSTAVRAEPEVLEAARTQKAKEFIGTIRRDHPEQHISRRSRYRLNPTEEQKAEIEEAVELAIERGDANTREEAIFMWAMDYKQDCEQRILDDVPDGRCAHA